MRAIPILYSAGAFGIAFVAAAIVGGAAWAAPVLVGLLAAAWLLVDRRLKGTASPAERVTDDLVGRGVRRR
jgi:hypothetical protein